MSKGFAEASQGPVLDKKCLVPKIQVFTGFLVSTLCCLFRIGTFSNLRFDLLEGPLQTMLALFQRGMQEEEVLAKVVVNLRVEIFCFAWCSNSLRIGRGTHRGPRGLRRNIDLGKVCISFYILSS